MQFAALLLAAVPDLVKAVSALVTKAHAKKPVADEAADLLDKSGDLIGALVTAIPQAKGTPTGETVSYVQSALGMLADGHVTREEALALGQGAMEIGAAWMAYAGAQPEPVASAALTEIQTLAASGASPQEILHAARGQRRQRRAVNRATRILGMRPGGRPQVAHVLPTAPATKPAGGTIGDGWAEPVVDDAVVDGPPVEVIPAEPVLPIPSEREPDPGDSGGPLAARPWYGTVRVVVAMHADGLTKPGCDVPAWLDAAEKHAVELSIASIPASWEFTAPEVRLIEQHRPGWLATLAQYGITVAAREPHKGGGTAADAQTAIIAAGCPHAGYLGSCLNAADYVGREWPVITGVGSIGHTADAEWSGVKELAPGYVVVGSGTAMSTAMKREMANAAAQGAGFGEVIRYNGMNPQTGAGPYFGPPATYAGTHDPVSIVDDIGRLLGDVERDGHRDAVLFTTYPELVEAWRAAGNPPDYVWDRA